jgi:pyruvate/2-oxoglutarate dehydrogenase complex dihydrolipoamide acyltransferase (E2) component
MPRSNRNKVNLSGLVVAAPELTVENDSDVLHMEVRSRRYRRRGDQLVEYYDLVNIDVHGRRAKPASERVCNGMVVDITGRIEARDRPLQVDGEYVYDAEGKRVTYRAVTIVATRVSPLSSPLGSDRRKERRREPDAQGADSPAAGGDEPEGDRQTAAPEVRATEAAAELARKHGIDLAEVEGHGQVVDGLPTITKPDVAVAVSAAEKEATEAADLRRTAASEVAGDGPEPDERTA